MSCRCRVRLPLCCLVPLLFLLLLLLRLLRLRCLINPVVGHRGAGRSQNIHELVPVMEQPAVLYRGGEVVHLPPHAALASKAERVRVQGHPPLARYRSSNLVSLVVLVGAPVENKEQRPPLKHQHLLLLVHVGDPLVGVGQEVEPVIQLHHSLVPGQQLAVQQVIAVPQTPLPPCIVVAPAITITREVDPLGVTKLIAHEGEVALTPQSHGHQADHLVQGHPPRHHPTLLSECRHTLVHLGAHQPECNGLISHEGLVVTLGVADGPLRVTPVAQCGHQVPHAPVLVPHVLEQLDPAVRDGHSQPVVKAHTSLRHRAAQRWHPAHILCHRDGLWQVVVYEVIGQHEVHHRVHIGGHTKVLVVVAAEACVDAVVVVQHARHAVKAEAVKLVLVQPPAQVGEQVARDLPSLVIEAPAVPQPVVAALPTAKVVGLLALPHVKACQAVIRVGADVRVHHIQQHVQPQPVRLVHQALELLWGSGARADCEGVCHVVTE
mmetsp:Transcript_7040/g.15466  ORF Transcript_7040/g.15466 Transcript_7040/m.15466 type:complete len:492 (-) Transcript_7040:1049-2524(-)